MLMGEWMRSITGASMMAAAILFRGGLPAPETRGSR